MAIHVKLIVDSISKQDNGQFLVTAKGQKVVEEHTSEQQKMIMTNAPPFMQKMIEESMDMMQNGDRDYFRFTVTQNEYDREEIRVGDELEVIVNVGAIEGNHG